VRADEAHERQNFGRLECGQRLAHDAHCKPEFGG
jgi:hypothetical protein